MINGRLFSPTRNLFSRLFLQVSRGSFRLVESELIDKLDLLISENKGDDEYRELFSTM